MDYKSSQQLKSNSIFYFRYKFSNCLEYINKFIENTANLKIPDNLKYMINKKIINSNSFSSPL